MSKKMYVPDPIKNADALKKAIRFETFKKGKIEKELGGKKHDLQIRYNDKAFLDFLDNHIIQSGVTGMRVYFACYPQKGDADCNDEHVPKDHEGHLTLIFVATNEVSLNDLKDIETYYIYKLVNPITKSYSFLPTQDKQQAKRWVDSYVKRIRNKHLDQDCASGEDTNSVWYSIRSVTEMRQDIPKHPLYNNSISVFFSAYDANEPPIYAEVGKYQGGSGPQQRKDLPVSNQLGLIFGTGETTDSFLGQSPKTGFWQRLKKIFFTDPADYDTGAPCPPAEGCSGSSLYP